jgi:5-methylcytosine-specific restriction endonuclease McrA
MIINDTKVRYQYEKAKKLILKIENMCGICGNEVDKRLKYPDQLSPTIDHIIPLAKGGHPFAIENLQLAHRTCNRQKSDKLLGTTQDRKKGNVKINKILPNNLLPLSYKW